MMRKKRKVYDAIIVGSGAAALFGFTTSLLKNGRYALRTLIFLLTLSAQTLSAPSPNMPRLRVGASGHYFETEDGKPFFWLGDSAFFLAKGSAATKNLIEAYFRDRKAKGFTIIRLDAIHDDNEPNSYGDRPLVEETGRPALTPGSDFGDAAEWDYWDNLDWIIDAAARHGLYLELQAFFVGHRGEGYNWLKISNAFRLGEFLGDRYKTHPHIVWNLGGDKDPQNETEIKIWREVARGLAVAYNDGGAPDYAKYLAGYHPLGSSSSSKWFHDEVWLDYNCFQTNNVKNVGLTHSMTLSDYRRETPKPVVLEEGWYEDNPNKGLAEPISLRREAYQTYLGGGHYNFGNARVKAFDNSSATYLNSTGAKEVAIAARILRSVEWWKLTPDQSLIVNEDGQTGHTTSPAAITNDRRRIVLYFATNDSIEIDMNRLREGGAVKASWVRPTDRSEVSIGYFSNKNSKAFRPPAGWEDAVLILSVSTEPREDRKP